MRPMFTGPASWAAKGKVMKSNKNAENSDDLIRILIMWFLFRGKINHKIQNAKYS